MLRQILEVKCMSLFIFILKRNLGLEEPLIAHLTFNTQSSLGISCRGKGLLEKQTAGYLPAWPKAGGQATPENGPCPSCGRASVWRCRGRVFRGQPTHTCTNSTPGHHVLLETAPCSDSPQRLPHAVCSQAFRLRGLNTE